MKLYFLRHAIAMEPGTRGIKSDADRPLTDEGIKKTKESLRGFKALELAFDAVASSPYLRAKHTAEIVTSGLRLKHKIIFSEALTPHAEWKDFFKFLQSFHDEDSILFVGHQPTMGHFISTFISGGLDARINLRKGGLALVEASRDSQQGEFEWLLTAQQLGAFK